MAWTPPASLLSPTSTPCQSTRVSHVMGMDYVCSLSVSFVVFDIFITSDRLDRVGSRGISKLVILAEMMHQIRFGTNDDKLDRPFSVFNMIGGVGSGGWVELSPSAVECMSNYSLDSLLFFSLRLDWPQRRLLTSLSISESILPSRKWVPKLGRSH